MGLALAMTRAMFRETCTASSIAEFLAFVARGHPDRVYMHPANVASIRRELANLPAEALDTSGFSAEEGWVGTLAKTDIFIEPMPREGPVDGN